MVRIGVEEGEFVYTIQEIKERVAPVARAYHLRRVYLFGSFARGDADDASDVDLLVDAVEPFGLFRSESLRQDLAEGLQREVDLVHLECLESDAQTDSPFLNRERQRFAKTVTKERVLLYEGS